MLAHREIDLEDVEVELARRFGVSGLDEAEGSLMSQPPAWMESLIDIVANCMEPHSQLGPLAYRWRNEGGYWEMWVYPAPAELVGGAEDGAVVSPGFSLDVQELSSAFEELEDVHWQAHAFGPPSLFFHTY